VTTPPIIEMEGISRAFHGVRALDDVSFACQAGEVHALVGENGAGKSTLIKILSGAYRPDAGLVRLNGETVAFSHPVDALRAGISVIYQDFSVRTSPSIRKPSSPTCQSRSSKWSRSPRRSRSTPRCSSWTSRRLP
jgi:ABC-type sugar transport system ATPase subunit